jgi:hypothetical protein
MTLPVGALRCLASCPGSCDQCRDGIALCRCGEYATTISRNDGRGLCAECDRSREEGTFCTLGHVEDEANRAFARYGDFTSTHEALGVLLEEFDELKDAIHGNILPAVAREAIQVAAVALRLAELCERDGDAFRERSMK